MITNYEAFNNISSPVAVFGPAGERVYSNEPYNRQIRHKEAKKPADTEGCDSGLVFATEKGVVKCYSVSADIDSGGNKICIYKDVTPFVSRKSMTEILASDTEGLGEYAQRKIVQKNLRMSSLIDSLESGIFVEGSSGSLIQVNNSFLKIISEKFLTKLPEDDYNADYYHKVLAELIHTDDYFAEIKKIKSESREGPYVDEVKFKDGRVYMRTFRPLFLGDEAKGYLWKFKDITVKKELENFNTELEANIRALESCESVGIYMEYSGYRFVNTGLVDLLETDRETLMSEGIGGFIPGLVVSCESSGSMDQTFPFEKHDGSIAYLNLVSDCVTVSGKTALVITVKDNTEHLLLQKDLEKNENRFRNIFEKNLAVMLIFDPLTMRIVGANESAVKFYGKSHSELSGLEMCDITIVGDMNACMLKLRDVIAEQTGSRIPVQQIVADGTLREVELLMTPLGQEEGNLLFVIVDDVHERLKYQRQLESLNDNLIDLVEKEAVKRRRQEELLMEKSRLAEMGEMIGNIAHQWRQPLSALSFIIQDMSDACEYGELTPDYVTDVITKSMVQIEYMSKTIDDFRDFFKPSTKQTIFDVKDNISQVLSIFLPQLKNTGVELKVECVCESGTSTVMNTDTLNFCDCHNIRIKGYANQFKQVLLNLLANSRYAVADKEVKGITIRIIGEAERVKVMVEDTGGGIPEDIISKIFESYFTTKSCDGTGIGLYMSKAIVEDNLGGSLTVKNTAQGCQFKIEVARVVD